VVAPVELPPLGRRRNHDPRNRNYPRALTRPASEIRSVRHKRLVPVYTQAEGSCVLQTYFGVRSTQPDRHRFTSQKRIRARYALVTHEDPFEGAWELDGSGYDTGTDITTACNVGLRLGEISRFEHIFDGLAGVLDALQDHPVPVGGAWLSEMDHPDASGLVHIRGPMRGGHQFYIYGNDHERRRLYCWNHWGRNWGLEGAFSLDYGEFDEWIMHGGDATVIYP
jgi:hypothetical protein